VELSRTTSTGAASLPTQVVAGHAPGAGSPPPGPLTFAMTGRTAATVGGLTSRPGRVPWCAVEPYCDTHLAPGPSMTRITSILYPCAIAAAGVLTLTVGWLAASPADARPRDPSSHHSAPRRKVRGDVAPKGSMCA